MSTPKKYGKSRCTRRDLPKLYKVAQSRSRQKNNSTERTTHHLPLAQRTSQKVTIKDPVTKSSAVLALRFHPEFITSGMDLAEWKGGAISKTSMKRNIYEHH